MANQLAIRDDMALSDLGQHLVRSGFFQDARDVSQAVVKVLAGRELGFGPVASMTGIYIVKGRVTLSANLIAAAIKRTGKYNYRIATLDDTQCLIVFFENGQEIGRSSFTMAEAKRAGLEGGDNWKKYPRNMLFARAMSNGAKWYTPDVFGGPIYTPDELGAVIDGETGEVIESVAVDVQEKPKPEIKQPEQNGHARPYPPEILKAKIAERAEKHKNDQMTENQRKILASCLDTTLEGDSTRRYELCAWLVGESSTKKMAPGQVLACLEWLGISDFNQPPSEHAITEARQALDHALKAAGQQTLNL